MKNMKRIQSVTIKRTVDDSPDTSHLGDYAQSPDSEFSIDRAHDLDCACQSFNKPTKAIELLEHIIGHLENQKDACRNVNETDNWKRQAELDSADLSDAQDICIEAQDELAECTCNRGACWSRREYRYFNPNASNYAGLERAEIVEYCLQDYDRMESYNTGDWCYVGVMAEATILLPCNANDGKPNGLTSIRQTITSGGLWGTQSDSDASHFEQIEREELAELKEQLSDIGFSKRAIATAFKSIERKDS